MDDFVPYTGTLDDDLDPSTDPVLESNLLATDFANFNCKVNMDGIFVYSTAKSNNNVSSEELHYCTFFNGKAVDIADVNPKKEDINVEKHLVINLNNDDEEFPYISSFLSSSSSTDEEFKFETLNNPDNLPTIDLLNSSEGPKSSDCDLAEESSYILNIKKEGDKSVSPKLKYTKKATGGKRKKLHEIEEPLSDEDSEKRRLGAINARKNREDKKQKFDYLTDELNKEKERNKELMSQLKIKQAEKKIACLEKENLELKYQIITDKYNRLEEKYNLIYRLSNRH